MPGPHQNVPMGEIAMEETHCSWYKKLFLFIYQGFGSCTRLYRTSYCIHIHSFILKVILQWETWEYFEYESASSLLSFPPLNMQTEHRFFLESFVCHEKSKLCTYVAYVGTHFYLHFNM